MLKKCISCLTAAASAAAMMVPAGVHAEEEASYKKIVIIGDSVTAGANLAINESSIADLLGYWSGAEVVNLSDSKADTGALLAMLDTEEAKTQLSTADLIIFTGGMHDIMDPFIEQADIYRQQFGLENFSDIFDPSITLESLGVSSEKELIVCANTLAKKAKQNKLTAQENILAIGEKLSVYSSAEIIALNVYNPMDTIEMYANGELSQNRKNAYDTVCNPIKGVINENINKSYSELGETYGFKVVDVYSLFVGKAYIYSCPQYLMPDPIVTGHLCIAEATAKAAGIPIPAQLGDVNNDDEINATDAAKVLIHAASVGGGGNGTLTEAQLKTADVNGDGSVNASDAAKILIYAAIKGGGGDPDFGRL